MKTCSKCKQEKELSEFYKNKNRKDGYNTFCKECQKEYSKNNKNVYKNNNIQYQKNKSINYYLNHEKNLEKNRKRYLNNKEYYKNYYIINKNKIKNTHKIYYINNKEKINNYNKININKLYHKSSNFKISQLLRNRINEALKHNRKSQSTSSLLGCSLEQYKNYLQSTAISNSYEDFDINNYNSAEYHIDHIVPCSAFNLKCGYHQRLCFNWSNMQILRAKKNLEKSDNIILY